MNDHPEYSTPQARPAVRTVPGGGATAPELQFPDPSSPEGATYYFLVPAELARMKPLRSGPKLLYTVLLWHGRQTDRCWPSNRRLGIQLGVCRRTIINWSHTLVRAGLIRRPEKRAFRNQWTLLYRPPLPIRRAPSSHR